MCSWCFAASRHVENAMAAFAGRVDFDLILGGINTHATQQPSAITARNAWTASGIK